MFSIKYWPVSTSFGKTDPAFQGTVLLHIVAPSINDTLRVRIQREAEIPWVSGGKKTSSLRVNG